MSLWFIPKNMKRLVGGPPCPPPLVAQAFQPVRRTGKMPVPPKTFQGKGKIVFDTHIASTQILAKF
jgi:hypothetical protein